MKRSRLLKTQPNWLNEKFNIFVGTQFVMEEF